jgi:NTP pyrophosphatase (non-canonical NTP hydrolase)
MSKKTIREWQRIVHQNSCDKGFWDTDDPDDINTQLAKLALIHSEVSEAAEAVRIGDIAPRRGEHGKPEGMAAELADVIIRVLDLAEALGLDMGAAVEEKHEHNTTRPRRHGGKLA